MAKLIKTDWTNAVVQIGARLFDCVAAYNLPAPGKSASAEYAMQVYTWARRDPATYAWTSLVFAYALASAFSSEAHQERLTVARAYYLATYAEINPESFAKHRRQLLAADNAGELCRLLRNTCTHGLAKELHALSIAFANIEAERQARLN